MSDQTPPAATPAGLNVNTVVRAAVKQCPNCGATIFQGPFTRGEVRADGSMDVRETMFQCMGCNAPWNLEQLHDH